MADESMPATAKDVREAYEAAQDHADAAAMSASKLGAAASIRMQVTALRSQADFLMAQARTFEGIADDFERGVVPLPRAAPELRMVFGNDEPEDDAEREDAPAGFVELYPEEGAVLSPTMRAFFEMFDDRIRRSPYFRPAVNEAAEAERRADDETARIVAARTRELAEQGGEGGEG